MLLRNRDDISEGVRFENEKRSAHVGSGEFIRVLRFYLDGYLCFKVLSREEMRSTCILDKLFRPLCGVEMKEAGSREISQWLFQ